MKTTKQSKTKKLPTNKAVENFHMTRQMFCIFDDEIHIAPSNLSYSHEEWFIKEGWIKPGDKDFITKTVRGFKDAKGDIYFYIGLDFEINKQAENIFFKCLPELTKALNLRPEAKIFGGLKKSEPGIQWPGENDYGTVAGEAKILKSKTNSKIYSVLLITEIVFIAAALVAAFFLNDKRANRNTDTKSGNTNEHPAKTSPEIGNTLTASDVPEIPDPTPVLDNNNFDKNYDYPPVAQKTGTIRVPVLTYHHVNKLPAKGGGRDYYVTPQMFDRQMAYLKAKNYRTLSLQEFYNQLKLGENPKQKSVLITFDDSNKDNYTNAFPILVKYGFKATFFVVSNKSGITSSQMREMSKAGMDIASHTQTHRDLTKITDDNEVNKEVGGSKASLSYITGKNVIGIAYPGCVADSADIKHVASVGYLLGFTCSKKIDNSYYNRYTLNRVHVYSNFENFKQRLSGICNYTASFE